MRCLPILSIALVVCSCETSVEPSLEEGGLLAFGSDRGGNSDIHTIRIDDRLVRNLTDHPEFDATPAWSRDGQRIAFVRGNRLMVMDADGSHVTEIATNVVGWPTWSPDGATIAFMAFDPFPNQEIHVISANGSARQNITNNSARDEWPSWSPDGQTIVFISDRDGTRDIYTMSPNGGNLRQLTVTSDAHHLDPSWSHDGRLIVFIRALYSGGDGFGIHTMGPDGGDFKRIYGGGLPRSPAISPDGSKIAYIGFEDGRQDLFLVNTDGTGLLRLTNDAANDQHPVWR